ncbi:hypothetical protein [Streptomyces osmaniensis]|uniref:Uncharacterized protein n=1 Tax=Streptomyces osmaniensis TaxID=593134 RepID=A0ABP6YGE3_9ACTN|nr:hypothetical protein KJK32_33100 [Streptomyces sp. JCM17656]
MNSELPDLQSQSATDEMTSRTAHLLNTFLLGAAVMGPLLLLAMSIMSGKFLWLTVLDLVGAYGGLLVMLRGYRDDNRALKRWGAGASALTLLLCLVVLAILQ